MLWKCCTQYASTSGKLSSDHGTGKVQFSFQCQREAMPKNVQTSLIALISHASKVMLKILQARLQQYMKQELPDVQAEFRKGRGTRDKIPNICWVIKKQGSSRRTSTSALLTTPNSLTLWVTANWKILEEIEIPNHLTCLLREAWRAAIHGVTKSWMRPSDWT